MENAYKNYKIRFDTTINQYHAKTAIAYLMDNGKDTRFTFSEIYEMVLSAKTALQNCGIVDGDRAAIITPHSPYGVIAGLALAYMNVTAVLIDAALPVEEIARLLEFSDVRALFTTEELFQKIPSALTKEIPCFALGAENTICSFLPQSTQKVCRSETADKEPDVISIIFSSGTTDQMKGIKVTYHSVLRAREVFADLSGLRDSMSYLLVLPFNHIAGFTGAMTFFLTGCELDFLEHVDPLKLQQGLRFFQPHYFAMIPKVYEIMEEKIRARIHAKGKLIEGFVNSVMKVSGFMRKNLGVNIGRTLCRSIVSEVFGKNIYGIGTGASPCKDSTTEFFLNLGLEWANLYATTETGVPITATGIQDRYPVGTVGNVNRHKGIEVKIHQPDGGGVGEIVVKTDLIMKGYFRRPDLTEAAFCGGYFRTGDYGCIDAEGNLHITGRIKEAIVLKTGKKVSPSDVDAYYSRLCGGVKIASCGVSGPEGFDTVHLFMETRGHSRAEINEVRGRILKHSSASGSVYQISAIHETEQLPLTSIGKIKRYILKELAENGENSYRFTAASIDGAESVFDVICGLIASIAGTSGTISPDSRLQEDIGMDSLEVFELCVALEEKFPVPVESFLHGGITVREMGNFILNGNKSSGYPQIDGINTKNYPVKKTDRMIKHLKNLIGIFSIPYDFSISGLENIPKNENIIICANHASYFDPLWILNTVKERIDLKKIAGLAAYERLNGFFSRKLFFLLGEIPVNRTGNTLPVLYRARECLEENYTMIIFPEGARSRDGSMLPFKNGAAELAKESKKDIVPVYIGGAFEIFPRHKKFPRLFDWKHLRRYPLQIRFGTPISPDTKTAEEITGEIRRQIIEMKQEWTL